jgi:putative transposase
MINSPPVIALQPEFCYHVTTRCNNREFKLIHRECREVFIYALTKAIKKFDFKPYAICLMSNHVHYLIEPKTPESLPKIMHLEKIYWLAIIHGCYFLVVISTSNPDD